VKDSMPLLSLGKRVIKGFDHALEVFAVAQGDIPTKSRKGRLRRRQVAAEEI